MPRDEPFGLRKPGVPHPSRKFTADAMQDLYLTMGLVILCVFLVVAAGVLWVRATSRRKRDPAEFGLLAADCEEQAARLRSEAEDAENMGDLALAEKRRAWADEQAQQANRLKRKARNR